MKKADKIRNITRIALYSVLLVICSWISVPFAVPITLQTFAVFFLLYFAGAKKTLAALTLYTILGIIGLPVFSGFGNGLSVLLGTTGGYVLGFFAAGAVYFAAESIFKENINNPCVKYIASFLALFACYSLGVLGIMRYASGSELGFFATLGTTTAAYLLPDIAKIICADILNRCLRNHIKA